MTTEECIGCGAALRDTDLDCLYCRRPNPFARARQAAKAIEVTALGDYHPSFVFDGTLTAEEAREFTYMWAKHQSRPQAWIPNEAAVDGAYALKQIKPIIPKQPDPIFQISVVDWIGSKISRLFR